MSATAVTAREHRAPNFWQSTNGKKVVMAVTGAIMFLFIIGHLLGNLLVFAGPARINAYAEFLHFDGALLWIIRTVLIVSVILHITATVQLALAEQEGAPGRLLAQRGDQLLVCLQNHVLERTHRSRLYHLPSAPVHCGVHSPGIAVHRRRRLPQPGCGLSGMVGLRLVHLRHRPARPSSAPRPLEHVSICRHQPSRGTLRC